MRLANATRMATAGLEHRDYRALMGEDMACHLHGLRKAGLVCSKMGSKSVLLHITCKPYYI